jgi:hypothetical protein
LVLEVFGKKSGNDLKIKLWTEHPPMSEWGGKAAYYKNIAIPLSIGAQMIARGDISVRGVVPPELAIDPEMLEMFEKLAQTVIDGEPEDAAELAQQALAQGLDALDCINKGLSPGIDEVGELFATGEYYLPDLILGGDAMISNLLWPEARTARSWGELCSAR